MPITENGTIEYKMPKEIKDRIPHMFYEALFGELVSVCGYEMIMPDIKFLKKGRKDPIKCYTDMLIEYLSYCEGTSGYTAAFNQTCAKLSMDWLSEYADSLEWFDSDIFFSEISGEMIKVFFSDKIDEKDNYYKFLFDRQNKK